MICIDRDLVYSTWEEIRAGVALARESFRRASAIRLARRRAAAVGGGLVGRAQLFAVSRGLFCLCSRCAAVSRP